MVKLKFNFQKFLKDPQNNGDIHIDYGLCTKIQKA